ncbi:MAG: hypothetical protein M3Z32_09285 [Acidobacteriota bacterium]|nr:hypothetical protein [Acidobacteriota bacterium]
MILGKLKLFPVLLCLCHAEIIDRIAVSVGNQVITEAQISDEIRITAFLNNQEPDLSQAFKKAAAERLVEQTLVRREMEVGHFPLPDLSEAEPLEEELQTKYGSSAGFNQELSRARITQSDLKQHLLWQLTLLRFIDYRFRPSVQIQDSAIKDYYSKQRAEWEQRGDKPIPSLEDSRAAIEKILIEQRVDAAMDRWLGDSRTRIEILYRKEAFE